MEIELLGMKVNVYPYGCTYLFDCPDISVKRSEIWKPWAPAFIESSEETKPLRLALHEWAETLGNLRDVLLTHRVKNKDGSH